MLSAGNSPREQSITLNVFAGCTGPSMRACTSPKLHQTPAQAPAAAHMTPPLQWPSCRRMMASRHLWRLPACSTGIPPSAAAVRQSAL